MSVDIFYIMDMGPAARGDPLRTKIRFLRLAVLILFALIGQAAAFAAVKLPERYQKWLDEEVAYIIAPTERDVFQKLQTDRERDLFIEAFWKHRDPTPASPENEFKTEHYRRINYANHFLGREAPQAGWRTDRGRMYIILGEPNDINRMQGKGEIYDCEIWFYQGKTDMGLPPGFNLLFFKEGGSGSYKLYSPTNDGPQALMAGYIGSSTDYYEAYKKLRDIDPILADTSLSLIPGDQASVYGRPSLVSDMMIQKVEGAAQRMVEDKYARKFLEYKDVVEVEYSANYLESDSLVKVLRGPSGTAFVHYAIEPKRLSVNDFEKKYYTVLKVNGNVTTTDGRLVYQFDKTVNLEWGEEDMGARSNQPFDLHDVFPLVPGDYKLSLLVKNEVSKEFTSVEQALRIPGEAAGVLMTAPILAYDAGPADPAAVKVRPFRLASRQLKCQPGRVFVRKDALSVAFQLLGLGDDLRAKGEVKYAFFRQEQPFREMVRKASEYETLPDVIETFQLTDFPPDHYRVQVSLVADGAEVVMAREEFDVTFADAIPRPWIYARILPDPSDPIYARLIGLQLFNLGRFDESRSNLESAHGRRPSEDTAAELARTLLALKDFATIDPLLAPYLAQEKPARYEAYLIAGRAARESGNFARAIEVYDIAVAHYGANTILLNFVGESYFGLGRFEEARAVWERSLSVDPNQPEISKKVDLLKSKKNP
jgi:GWxTD domain-containing protein